jgi:hypothetical protein
LKVRLFFWKKLTIIYLEKLFMNKATNIVLDFLTRKCPKILKNMTYRGKNTEVQKYVDSRHIIPSKFLTEESREEFVRQKYRQITRKENLRHEDEIVWLRANEAYRSERNKTIVEYQKFYSAKNTDELKKLWDLRGPTEVSEKFSAIRSILRGRSGIMNLQSSRQEFEVCGGCFRPRANCTCERGWW